MVKVSKYVTAKVRFWCSWSLNLGAGYRGDYRGGYRRWSC